MRQGAPGTGAGAGNVNRPHESSEFRSLRDATAADVGSRLSGVLQRRARHVVSENERVARAAEVLRSADPRQVGPLLASSHASLRDDFEVSCAELDLAVDTAMGAGRGGRG